jgi:hypothetical protein
MSIASLPTIHCSGLACHCYKGSHRLHDVFPRSTALRPFILHSIEPSVGRRCSPQPNMSSTKYSIRGKNTSTLCCRGKHLFRLESNEYGLSDFIGCSICRRDSSGSCRMHHISTSTPLHLRQERCSFECLSFLGSYTRTRKHLPVSSGNFMLTRR